MYSWIACQLEVGTPIITFAVEVRFKTEISFEFLSPNYTKHVT